jgi:hypothetical protein
MDRLNRHLTCGNFARMDDETEISCGYCDNFRSEPDEFCTCAECLKMSEYEKHHLPEFYCSIDLKEI